MMSISEDDAAWDDYAYEEYQAQEESRILEAALKEIEIGNVRSFLLDRGRESLDRAILSVESARKLKKEGFWTAAVVSAATSVEITVRDLLLTPLLFAATHSENWADLLARQVMGSRIADVKKVLPKALALRGFKLEEILMPDRKTVVWDYVNGNLWEKRNRIVHRGETANRQDALLAIASAAALLGRASSELERYADSGGPAI